MGHHFLGELEQMILMAVLRLGDSAYSALVRREIADRTGRQVARGALYTSLERLESKGFLKSRMGDPLPERGGRARRYLAVTPRGVRALRDAQQAMAGLREGLDALMERP